MSNFVYPEELSYFVESVRPFQLIDVGSNKWMDVHEIVIRLSQQAILEAAEHREEEVKELLILKDKLKVLIHEAYCISLWKTRVLPHLLDIDPNPQATFLIYTVLFHEGAVIALLDTSLFHVSACETLKESAIDLIDYCAQGVAQLIGLASMRYHENETNIDVDEAVLTELERQKRDLIYKIGLRCISLSNYLADNVSALPLNAARRLVVTHDIPWLMVDLLNFRPWQRHTKRGLEKYIDERWTLVQGDSVAKVVKQEAQAWFCLRQLLFNKELMESYEMNSDRRKHISLCQGMLNDLVLDQLPPLIELKEFLCHLGVMADNVQNNKKNNLVLEEVPEIREKLVKESERAGGYLAIAQHQESIFLNKEREKIFKTAQKLNSAYNTDLLADLEQKMEGDSKVQEEKTKINKCNKCSATAEKKCANCKSVFYCSKKCQLEDWPQHKANCIRI